MRAIVAFFGATVFAGSVHGAQVSFRPPAKGERWPAVELKREAKDGPRALEARVTLRQVSNPRQVFGPYLTAKEVGSFPWPAGRSSLRQPLERLVRVPASSLVPGRYEMRVTVLTTEGLTVGEGVASFEEDPAAAVRGDKKAGRGSAGVLDDAPGGGPEREGDPKLAVLDPRELASLPSNEARMTAQTFAYVLATRDAQAFRQLVAERGLGTDKGTVPHAELERQVQRGLDPLLGPAPRAPWRVEFHRETPDRFTMKPHANARESVTFEKSADGRWRIGQVSRKRAATDDD